MNINTEIEKPFTGLKKEELPPAQLSLKKESSNNFSFLNILKNIQAIAQEGLEESAQKNPTIGIPKTETPRTMNEVEESESPVIIKKEVSPENQIQKENGEISRDAVSEKEDEDVKLQVNKKYELFTIHLEAQTEKERKVENEIISQVQINTEIAPGESETTESETTENEMFTEMKVDDHYPELDFSPATTLSGELTESEIDVISPMELESTSTTITPEALTGDRDVKLKGIETVLIQETGANADNPVSLAGKEPASDVPQATAFSGNNEPPAEFETGEKVFVEEAGVVLSETEPDELIDVSFLDKNKWQIRKEKDIEHFNFERVRRETSDTVKEMKNGNDSGFADKDSRSSDKSRSGIAGEFSLANMKEKIRHSGPEKIAMEFNREQFKNSLNELVRHAKLNIVENGKSTAQISLNPKELGKLTLNISVLKDTIEGKIFVESETIKNLIMSDLNLLKNELKAAGLNLEILQVEVRQESFADGFLDSEKKFRESMEKNDRAISGKQNAETADDEFISQRNSSRNLIDIKV